MERLRKILFLTVSVGAASAAVADNALENFKASTNEAIQRARQAEALKHLKWADAKLNPKKSGEEVVKAVALARFKAHLRKSGASGRLGNLLNRADFEELLFNLYERAKSEGTDVDALIKGDEELRKQLAEAGLLDSSGSLPLELEEEFRVALRNTLKDEGYVFSEGSGVPTPPSGGGGSSGGGGGAGGGKKAAGPASPGENRLDTKFEEPQGVSDAFSPAAGDNGPSVVQGPVKPSPEASEFAENPAEAQTAQKRGGYTGGPERGGYPQSRGNGLGGAGGGSGGLGGPSMSPAGAPQGNPQPQNQQASNENSGNNGGNGGSSGPHADTTGGSGAGSKGISGRPLLTSSSPKGAPQAAAKPQASAAAAAKKNVDPSIALVQKPFYESLLKEYEQSPKSDPIRTAKMNEIRERIKAYEKSIKQAYPNYKDTDACSILKQHNTTSDKIEKLLTDAGAERRGEIENLPMNKSTVQRLISGRFKNPSIKDFLSDLKLAKPTLECIAKENWQCSKLEKCGSDYLFANRQLCIQVKSAYHRENNPKDLLEECLSSKAMETITKKAFAQGICHAIQDPRVDDIERAWAPGFAPKWKIKLNKGRAHLQAETLIETFRKFRDKNSVARHATTTEGRTRCPPVPDANVSVAGLLYQVDQFKFGIRGREFYEQDGSSTDGDHDMRGSISP